MRQQIMNKIAVDTNVLLYFLDISFPERRKVAAEIITHKPIFNSQSLSELINVLNRRWKFPKEKILRIVSGFMEECEYIPLTSRMVTTSFELVKKYDFQIFDAFIVTLALEADCDILYSEDMQHKLVVEQKLTIINPFI